MKFVFRSKFEKLDKVKILDPKSADYGKMGFVREVLIDMNKVHYGIAVFDHNVDDHIWYYYEDDLELEAILIKVSDGDFCGESCLERYSALHINEMPEAMQQDLRRGVSRKWIMRKYKEFIDGYLQKQQSE